MFLKPALDVQRQRTIWLSPQPDQGNLRGRSKQLVTQIGLQKNRSVYAVSLSTVLSKTSLTKPTADIGDQREGQQEATNTTQVHQGLPAGFPPSPALIQSAEEFGFEICLLNSETSCRLESTPSHEAVGDFRSHLHSQP